MVGVLEIFPKVEILKIFTIRFSNLATTGGGGGGGGGSGVEAAVVLATSGMQDDRRRKVKEAPMTTINKRLSITTSSDEWQR